MSQGIPEQAEIPPVARVPASGQATNPPATNPPALAPQAAAPTGGTGGPNVNPLDLFPQVNSSVSNFKSSCWWSAEEFVYLLNSGPSKYGDKCWCRQPGFPSQQSTGI